MSGLQRAAMNDYNQSIQAVKDASRVNDIDTIVSVVRHEGKLVREVVNSNVNQLKELSTYETPGWDTPLFDSVADLIDLLQSAPDIGKPGVTFLVMAITDGQNNAGKTTGAQLGRRIQQLQSTDHWTFVFRVPRGYSRALEQLGIPGGNIQEWDQTERGMRESTVQTVSAWDTYYRGVKSGVTSTKSFYANMGGVSSYEVASKAENISREVTIYPVTARGEICNVVSQKTHRPYEKGTAFYQLTKTEKAVQSYKIIAVRNKVTGSVYAGSGARQILGLPTSSTIRLVPGNHGEWDIYIQSTSSNRILLPGTTVLYWPNWNNQQAY